MSKYVLSEIFPSPVEPETRTTIEARLIGRVAEVAHEGGMQFLGWPRITWRAVSHVGQDSLIVEADAEMVTREEQS